MSEKYIIDRIEGKIAICQDVTDSGKMRDIPLDILPPEIKEGSYLIVDSGIYSIDTESEAQARARIRSKMDRIFNR